MPGAYFSRIKDQGCIRSGVISCTLFRVLYLCRMCQCGLHAVLWSHIGMLLLLLAAEPRTTAGLSFPSLWNDLADPVFDGVGLAGFKSRAHAEAGDFVGLGSLD